VRLRCAPGSAGSLLRTSTETVGPTPGGVAITPDGKTAFVTDFSGTVSTIDVKTRTKHPNDITVSVNPGEVVFTPCRR